MQQKFHKNQIQAIEHHTGPMLVLAGPGSGKTTVIVARVRYLIEERKIPPQRILVITFTRAAADEMKQRFLAQSAQTGVQFGTFHSIFFRILRQSYGYTLDDVLSETQKHQILRQILAQQQIQAQDEEEYIRQFVSQLSLMQNELESTISFQPEGLPKDEFVAMVQAYEAAKAQMQKIDFDDMLTQCYALLSQNEKVRQYWQNRFSYILVDEFQDINQAQYACLQILAAPNQNLFVVGDDDQSIYGFRGARPDFMLDFPKDFPNTKTVILDVNFRSTGRIIRLAERAIAGNTSRYQKNIQGNRDIGAKVHVFTAEDSTDEAELIASKIAALLESGMPGEEIAILYRTNVQGGAFARALYRRGIAYHLREGGMDVYTHWIAKDLEAYLFLAENEESDSAFLRICNKPKRYISKEALAQAETMPYSLLRSLEVLPTLQRWQAERLSNLRQDLAQIRRRAPHEALRYVRNVVGYDEYLAEYAAYRKASLPNMMEIANEITETAKGTKDSAELHQRLQEMSAQMQTQQNGQKKKESHAVTLSTFHGAKGLEFSAVFLPSLVEGVLPHERSRTGSALEEERRLFYVGLTRTKDSLFLSAIRSRYDQPVKPSRFLSELGLPPQMLQTTENKKPQNTKRKKV